MLHDTLPPPSDTALAVSHALSTHIRNTLQHAGGWLSFSEYMELALYAPGLGYYSAGSHKLGRHGDFVTAPELTPLFAQTVARQIAQLLPQTAGTLLEFGAGSGRLAADLLQALEALNTLPTRLLIVEISPDLIERQHATLAHAVPHLLSRIEWLSTLPEHIDGVVIGNEVLDAMPCELVRRDADGQLWRRGICANEQGLAWQDRPLRDPQLLITAQACVPQREYQTELSRANAAFIRTLGERLLRGALLLIDYGFPAAEFYHPDRHMGTLICHYRHHTHHDPLWLPGLSDITSHVNFSAVAVAGIDAGLDLIGYTTQAQFLINCGITDALAQLDPNDPTHYLPHAAAVHTLLAPAEMGELFKVIGWGRNVSIDWLGFMHGDRCHTL